jgi:MFS family permease
MAVSANRIFFSRFAISSLQLSPEVAGRLMGLFAMGLLVGALPAGLLGARWGRRRVMQGGLLLCASSLSTNSLIDSVPPLAVAQVVSGASLALVMVNALPLVLDHAPPLRDGVYSGLFYLATQLAEILGPILSGSVLHRVGNARALFVISPLMLLLACACLRGVRRGGAVERAPRPREPLPATRYTAKLPGP